MPHYFLPVILDFLLKYYLELNSPALRRGVGEMIITLKVYDITGREIQTLVNDQLQPRTYEVTFDGSNLPSGIYFYRMIAGEYTNTKKLVLLK
jgi:hypothetical protein